MRINMFRALPHPSSGAYNCINSVWFYRWSVAVAVLLVEPTISAGERPAAARLLRSWVRIPPGAWIFVCCECRVLSGRGLCDELITGPEESYRLCCIVVCDLETSRIGAPYIYIYIHIYIYIYIYIYDVRSLRVNKHYIAPRRIKKSFSFFHFGVAVCQASWYVIPDKYL